MKWFCIILLYLQNNIYWVCTFVLKWNSHNTCTKKRAYPYTAYRWMEITKKVHTLAIIKRTRDSIKLFILSQSIVRTLLSPDQYQPCPNLTIISCTSNYFFFLYKLWHCKIKHAGFNPTTVQTQVFKDYDLVTKSISLIFAITFQTSYNSYFTQTVI